MINPREAYSLTLTEFLQLLCVGLEAGCGKISCMYEGNKKISIDLVASL